MSDLLTDNELNEAVARGLGWYQLGDGQWADAWHIQTNLPPYATDIAAAWEVVEHLYSKHLAVTVSRGHPRTRVMIRSEDGGAWETLADIQSADTAPRAICLAFLKLESGGK